MSVLRSKCGLQYRMNATYASVMLSAVTSFGGNERSVGRYMKAGSISMWKGISSRVGKLAAKTSPADKTLLSLECYVYMPKMFQLADTLQCSVGRMMDAEWYFLVLNAHVTLYFGLIDRWKKAVLARICALRWQLNGRVWQKCGSQV